MNQFEKYAFPVALVVLLAVQFQCERARAETDDRDSVELRDIYRSRSLQALERDGSKRDAAAKLPRLRAFCETQMQLKVLPVGCFELLEQESRLGLLTDERRRQTEAWLITLCAKTTAVSRGTIDLRTLRLPKACIDVIREKNADLEYKSSLKDPVSVFRQRF